MVSMTDNVRLSEVARRMGVSYQSVWRWCNDGKIATITLPSGQRRIPMSEVTRLLAEAQPNEA